MPSFLNNRQDMRDRQNDDADADGICHFDIARNANSPMNTKRSSLNNS